MSDHSPDHGKVYVVNHAHWDREWYRPFEDYRVRLVELVERVCRQLADGTLASFHLDGQTVTTADVLAVAPHLEPALRDLVAEGRLSLGPWHVLADNQLVSGENLIRNLLTARRWGERMGALSTLGYSPDAFGHPADLPRILRGFGMDTALVWRGAPTDLPRFRWRSPDGSEVFTVNQAYHAAEVLWWPEQVVQRLRDFVAAERERLPHGPWLLMNGGDHLAPKALAQRREQLAGHPDAAGLHEATMAEFFAAARTRAGDLPVITGELRHPGGHLAFLLPGTLSARIYLKQANERVQTLLERWVEPFTAIAGTLGGDPDAATTGLLRHAWELLLHNAPHDSICGCSVDAVHRQNMARFEAAEQAGTVLLGRALRDLGLDTRVHGPVPTDAVELAVLNPHGTELTGGVEVEVRTAPGRCPVGLRDPDGQPVPFDLTNLGTDRSFEADLTLMPDTVVVQRYRLAFVPADVPPFGWAVYRVELADLPTATHHTQPRADSECDSLPETDGTQPETEPGDQTVSWTVGADGRARPLIWRAATSVSTGTLHLVLEPDASLTVTDAITARTYRGLGRLVDVGDRGDTYNFDPVPGDTPVTPVLVGGSVRAGAARTELRWTARLTVPAGLTPDRSRRDAGRTVDIPVRVTATIWHGRPEVLLRYSYVNAAEDHRLRAHFPLNAHAEEWIGDAHFCTLTRPTSPPGLDLPTEPGFEATYGVAPVRSWAAIGGDDARRDLAVLLRGLPEVEGVDHGDRSELAVTLVRAVGWLSRFDLGARTAGAGPMLATPEAQCPGPQHAEVCLRFGTADAAIARAAGEYGAPLRGWQLGGRTAPLRRSLLRVDSALVSALKVAEDGDGLILRLSHPVTGAVDASVIPDPELAGRPVIETDLAETPLAAQPSDLDCDGTGTLRLHLADYGLRTLRLPRPRPAE